MNDEDGCFEIRGEVVWRPALVHWFVGPGRTFKLPLRKPKLLSASVHTGQVINAIVRDQYLKVSARIVVVSFDPVDHVAAVAGSGCAHAITVDELVATNHFCHAVHQIDVNLAAPIPADLIDKLLSVAGRASRVRCEHYIAGVGPDFRIPTITPAIVPCALRPAMNQNH